MTENKTYELCKVLHMVDSIQRRLDHALAGDDGQLRREVADLSAFLRLSLDAADPVTGEVQVLRRRVPAERPS